MGVRRSPKIRVGESINIYVKEKSCEDWAKIIHSRVQWVILAIGFNELREFPDQLRDYIASKTGPLQCS